MAISLRGRTRNPKKGMVTEKRAEARASGAVAKKLKEARKTISARDRKKSSRNRNK